jgi:hypothetical protein
MARTSADDFDIAAPAANHLISPESGKVVARSHFRDDE